MLHRTRAIREERRARFAELKRLHRADEPKRFGWTQGVGLVLIGVASLAAFDPDYPIPRDLARSASASARVYLLPEGGSLDGNQPIEDWRFEWTWEGPDVVWDLVILDASFAPRARMTGIRGCDARPNAALAAALSGSDARYWFVESELEGVAFGSMPRTLPAKSE